jgi:DNA-3-methyladenine glycosylase I
MTTRCAWAERSPHEIAYHDTEWGVPVHDDQTLFEFLILEGAQAGLSWTTILAKRAHYRRVYDRFDIAKVARYTPAKQARLLADPGIVRNKLKVAASVRNAQAVLKIQTEFGSLDAYLWRFVDGRPLQNVWKSVHDVPTRTPVSDALSKDLQKRGLTFVGSTIIYAFMQATGMVNDHLVMCFRHKELYSRA